MIHAAFFQLLADGDAGGLPHTDDWRFWAMCSFAGLTIVYAVFGGRFKKKKRDPLARSSSSQTLAQHRNVERDMSNLLVELSEMARQVTAQLDTRAAKLDLLIKEADEKIAALARANGAPQAGPPLNGIAAYVDANLSAALPPSIEAAFPDRHTDIYQLADAGHNAHQIAEKLGRPTGEVELILALRPR